MRFVGGGGGGGGQMIYYLKQEIKFKKCMTLTHDSLYLRLFLPHDDMFMKGK